MKRHDISISLLGYDMITGHVVVVRHGTRYIAAHFGALWMVTAGCSALRDRYGTLRYGAIRHVTLRCDTLQHVVVCCGALRHLTVRYRSLPHCMHCIVKPVVQPG